MGLIKLEGGMGSKKDRGGGTVVSREYKGSGQGGWTVREVRDKNRQVGQEQTRHSTIFYNMNDRCQDRDKRQQSSIVTKRRKKQNQKGDDDENNV